MQTPRRCRRIAVWPQIAAILALALAAAGCGSSGNTVTSPSSLSKCSVAFDAPPSTVPANGGDGSIGIKTERECQWSAQPEVNWLTITAGASGQGDGAVQFKATANGDPVARSGGVMVNGLRAQITQAAAECRFELANSSASFSQAGGTGTADLKASSPLCTWTAASDADWIAIAPGATGKGSASIGFTVSPTTGAPRSGTLTIAGLHFSVTQSEGCTFSIAPVSYAAGAAGGSQVVTVTAGPGCPWTAASNADWITVAPASGTGNGTVTLAVAPTSGPSRTGTLTIAGQTATVTQSPGCAFVVAPPAIAVDATGGTRTINVTSSSGCAWTSSATQSWITIVSGAEGNGSGTITIAIAAASGPPRSGSVVVAGQTVSITQGNGCAFAISSDTQSVPSSGGSGSVSVTSASGCGWSATSNVSWITVTAGASGSGNGTVNFTVAATNGPARAGTLTVAGRTFTVNQGQGCSFSLSAASGSVPAGGGTGTFDVRTAGGCGWSAASNANWLTVTGGANGSGNGTVQYSAAANTGPERSGTITAGGHTFTVTQGGGCSYSIAPPSQNVGSAGGNASVAVTAAAGCAWNASSNDGWIGIPGASSGSGNGNVQLVIEANAGGERRGTATIAGETFTIVQASGCSYSIAPDTIAQPAGSATQPVAITTTAECSWSAVSAATWITIPMQDASGTGSATVPLEIQANTGPARTGTATVAGRTVTVNQDSGCSVVLGTSTYPAPVAGGPNSVVINAADGCSWSATSNNPDWLHVTAGAGSGPGSVQFVVDPNVTGAPRTGTLTIAGQTFTVTQAGS